MADNNAQNNDGNKSKNEQDVDKGYSWIVLTGEFYIIFCLHIRHTQCL